ncbi:MAG TPA: aminotransferase class IV [Thermoanaerobaculia bacterium]|jgi:branched-subunit amino acid aminotransferase/4-amino-4-deoxychorismate lyase|nr:aminotransferase class IV [Thermoanaerobaculia bacterium]
MSLSWWNGRTVPSGEVRISPDDSGFLFGDGLFETLRVDDGRARDVEAHLDRLLAGLRRLEIDLPEDRRALEEAVIDVAAAAPRPVARLRLTVTRSTRLVTAAPYAPPSVVTACLLPRFRIDSDGPLAGLKSLCYQANRLALRTAEAQGAWEALLLNEHGRLVEGARSNLAVVLGEHVLTPPSSDGCLPGTVRRRLLEMDAIEEQPLSPGDLAAAGEVLLMNSLIGVLPVSRIDGREVPAGPTADRLRRLWAARLPSPA